MKIYLINYYLKDNIEDCGCESEEHHHHHHGPDDYEIIGNIKALGGWAHIMPTSFLLKTELSSNEILDKLKAFLREEDMIFITKVDNKDSASLTAGLVEWIENS